MKSLGQTINILIAQEVTWGLIDPVYSPCPAVPFPNCQSRSLSVSRVVLSLCSAARSAAVLLLQKDSKSLPIILVVTVAGMAKTCSLVIIQKDVQLHKNVEVFKWLNAKVQVI